MYDLVQEQPPSTCRKYLVKEMKLVHTYFCNGIFFYHTYLVVQVGMYKNPFFLTRPYFTASIDNAFSK